MQCLNVASGLNTDRIGKGSSEMGRFAGKRAVVTGGSVGIGAAIMARLAAEGAQVACIDIAAPENPLPDAALIQADLTDGAAAQAAVVAAVQALGGLDVLVNNAGIGCFAETPDLPEETWDKVFALNVGAVFHCCKAAIPAMRQSGGGAIVNIASISGLGGDYAFSAYNASKGAVINYTRSLAIDCAADGIRVNALCPGAIGGTNLKIGSTLTRELVAEWMARIPLGRFGSPEEMAATVAFMASDEASYMTGSIIVADGGITAHTGQPSLVSANRPQ
jgi:meso-butanediol dehydrogenase/(S,S)-butanediol dehydrogenase/diacetyl reductase